jgi:eukaryotic-like serine/threonine-protein kinase
MIGDLRAQLEHSLAAGYSLERELGGGGMSRVFVAVEKALGRRVVIKVLPPELAEGVNVERFKREIQLAAQLQHPHIVGVLSAGDANGLPYYTMPFVEGHSLRARLAAVGQMPLGEILGILRDVAKALSYAHDRGIVHRDIKPDNVLLTGGSAAVSDFGIAKAIAAARTPGRPTLTQLGSALGTPQYMAPEQAAADPDVDHRADIYAFGVMAYEMLAGRPPFSGSPQKLLTAHMSEQPQPLAELRSDTPAVLADIVMRCLAKEASDRPQSAGELAKTLDAVVTGDTRAAVMHTGDRARLARPLAIWVAAFVAAMILSRAAVIGFGLPDWVTPATIVVMLMGIPPIVVTYLVHRRAEEVESATATPGGSTPSHTGITRLALRASPHLSWRRTMLGGVYALGALILAVAGYTALRALGIGPVGSLLAKGTLARDQAVLVADFRSGGADSTLGPLVTEAFRTGLGQSQAVKVLPGTRMRDVLRRMQRDPKTTVDAAVAREIATREGLKAFIDGEVLAIGGRYRLGVRVVETQTGETVESLQEAAASEADILGAIDRLAKRMREAIGESLRDIREAPPLEHVTTSSLEALRKYVQGLRVIQEDGDFDRGEGLLQEAVALDSGFAMAYRKLAAEYWNRRDVAKATEMFTKAYEHRDRLTEIERYLATADFFSSGPRHDLARAAAAYESVLEIQPDHSTALNNGALILLFKRDHRNAQILFKRAADLPDAVAVNFTNLASAAVGSDDTSEALSALDRFHRRYPQNQSGKLVAAHVMYALGRRDSGLALVKAIDGGRTGDAATRANAKRYLGNVALNEAKLGEARAQFAAAWRLDARMDYAALESALDDAWIDAWHRNDAARARPAVLAALARHPIEAIPHFDRPYSRAVQVLTAIGETQRAKEVLALYERDNAGIQRWNDVLFRHRMRGDIAFAEGRYEDAVREYTDADVVTPCRICLAPLKARAYDRMGESRADSVIALYTRFVETADVSRIAPRRGTAYDADYLAAAYKRLGELWEQEGDAPRALLYYRRFTDLWKSADAELQPLVADVRGRIDRLERAQPR